jgi:hypothetical protein
MLYLYVNTKPEAYTFSKFIGKSLMEFSHKKNAKRTLENNFIKETLTN